VFREMRRKDRAISDDEAIKLLENGKFGVLSMTCENGYAYGIPLNYAYRDGNIYFHCAGEGAKLDNIRHNNKVSFCVVGETRPLPEKFSYSYESVVAFGKAEEISGKEKEDALFMLIEKYSADFKEKGREYINRAAPETTVVKISVEHITGKARR